MFSLSSLLELRCIALADNAWFTANPEEMFNKQRLDALSFPNYVIKKGRSHGARHGKTEVKIVPYSMECVEEMLQESRLPRWTCYRYSRSLPQKSSLSWITTRNRMDRTKVQRVGRTCKIRPYISSHFRGKEKIPRTMVSHLEQIWQKCAYETSIRFSSCCLYGKSSTPRVRRTSWTVYFSRKIQDMAPLFKHIVVGQVWMELETVGFVNSRWRSIVTDGVCEQNTLTLVFSRTLTWHDMTWHRIMSHHMTWHRIISPHMTWHDIASYHMTWHDMTWHRIISHDMTWHDMTWHDMTWHDMTWHDMTWHDMTWHDMTWHDMTSYHMTWHDMTWHDMTSNHITWHVMSWRRIISHHDMTFIASEPHLFFHQRMYSHTSCQMAWGLHSDTWPIASCTERAFRQPTNGPRSTHSGTQGKSEPCQLDECSLSLSLRTERESRQETERRKKERRERQTGRQSARDAPVWTFKTVPCLRNSGG